MGAASGDGQDPAAGHIFVRAALGAAPRAAPPHPSGKQLTQPSGRIPFPRPAARVSATDHGTDLHPTLRGFVKRGRNLEGFSPGSKRSAMETQGVAQVTRRTVDQARRGRAT